MIFEQIRFKATLWGMALTMLTLATLAQAAPPIRCTFLVNPVVSIPYSGTFNSIAGSFTVDCTKTGTIDYGISFTGTNSALPPFLAAAGANTVQYQLGADANCITPLTASYIGPTPVTNVHNFFLCIPAGQIGMPAAIYTDIVTTAFTAASVGAPTNAQTFVGTGTITVNIDAPAVCTITTPPLNIAFTYTSFNPAAVLANTSLGITCNNLLPYSIALDTPAGTVAGVNYTLALNTTPDTGGVDPLPGTGTGVAQTYFVNGSMAPGQAGTCAAATCAAAQTHVLTISY